MSSRFSTAFSPIAMFRAALRVPSSSRSWNSPAARRPRRHGCDRASSAMAAAYRSATHDLDAQHLPPDGRSGRRAEAFATDTVSLFGAIDAPSQPSSRAAEQHLTNRGRERISARFHAVMLGPGLTKSIAAAWPANK